MSDPRHEQEPRALHEWSGDGRNLPTVIFAQPPNEPSVTRGVTGLFVPMFLGLFIVLAVYFFAGAWQSSQELLRQQGISRDTAGLTAYIEDLESQNADLCRRIGDLPDRVERPTIEVQVQSARRGFDTQCQRNEHIQSRLSGGQSARCVPVTPDARSQPAATRTAAGATRTETPAEFRARICRSYATGNTPRPSP